MADFVPDMVLLVCLMHLSSNRSHYWENSYPRQVALVILLLCLGLQIMLGPNDIWIGLDGFLFYLPVE